MKRTTRKSIWQDYMDWAVAIGGRLPQVWPIELPAESTPGFWFTACKFEMTTRDDVNRTVQGLIDGASPGAVSALHGWYIRRRLEWAGQVALSTVEKGVEPDLSLNELLTWGLIETWQSDGCIGLWNHAERGGKPHPENPDGLAPLPQD